MKFRIILHPVCMAAFPVLFLYSHNVDEALFRDLGLPLALSAGSALVLWGLFLLALRRTAASALLASLVVLFILSFGHVLWLLEHFVVDGVFLGRARYLLPLWVVTLAIAAAWVIRNRDRDIAAKVSRAANRFGLIMVLLAVLPIAWFHGRQAFADGGGGAARHAIPVSEPDADGQAGLAVADSLPDIYYIVPDSYEADSSLRIEFGYDNSPFTDHLKAKGFYLASKSASNYAFTALSLTSSLNMEMLDGVAAAKGRHSSDMTVLNKMLSDNKVMAFLKSKGYTIINTGSWWGPTNSNRHADMNLRASRLNEFMHKWVRNTIFYMFAEELLEEDLREKTNFALENLAKIPAMPQPTFTMAHIICPHPPYVFGPDGGKVSALKRANGNLDARSLYLDQVKYINRRLIEVVDTILARSSRPPLILIQGDHGAAYTGTRPVFVETVPDDRYCKEQMRILNAYLLPGIAPGVLYDSISPVNSFRVVLNAYFGAELPLLEDRSYLSNRIKPYAFMDVTDRIKYR